MSGRESDSCPSGGCDEPPGKVWEAWARNRGNEEGAFGASGAILSTSVGWRETSDLGSEASLPCAMLLEEEGRLTWARDLS